MLARLLRQFNGEGTLTSESGKTFECHFHLKILLKGTWEFFCTCESTSFIEIPSAERFRFQGQSSEGLLVSSSDLLLKRWGDKATQTELTLVGTEVTVKNQTPNPTAGLNRYWLSNAMFQATQMSAIGKVHWRNYSELTINGTKAKIQYADWYDAATHLSKSGNYSIVSSFVDVAGTNALTKQEFEAFCWMFSLATGGWVACPAHEILDDAGKVIDGRYTDVFQNRAKTSQIIPDSTPWEQGLEHFLETTVIAYLRIYEEYDLAQSLGFYLEAKASTFAEVKFLLLGIAARSLGAAFARTNGLALDPEKAYGALGTKIGLHRTDVDKSLWRICDQITKTGKFKSEKGSPHEYYSAFNDIECSYLKLLGYKGPYINCAKYFREEPFS